MAETPVVGLSHLQAPGRIYQNVPQGNEASLPLFQPPSKSLRSWNNPSPRLTSSRLNHKPKPKPKNPLQLKDMALR